MNDEWFKKEIKADFRASDFEHEKFPKPDYIFEKDGNVVMFEIKEGCEETYKRRHFRLLYQEDWDRLRDYEFVLREKHPEVRNVLLVNISFKDENEYDVFVSKNDAMLEATSKLRTLSEYFDILEK